MSKMDNLKDMICRELEEIASKGELSAGDLETVYKLIVSKEKLLRIEEIEDDMGYSNDGDWRAEGTYARGRYSRDGYSRTMNRRGSYRGRYSNDGYSMRDRIEEMINSNELTSSQRSAMQRVLDTM